MMVATPNSQFATKGTKPVSVSGDHPAPGSDITVMIVALAIGVAQVLSKRGPQPYACGTPDEFSSPGAA